MKRNHFAIRRVIVILFVCCISCNAMAQKFNLDSLNTGQINILKEKATKMRNTGRVLTLIGIPASIIGTKLLINYMFDTPFQDWEGTEPNIYAALTLGGAAAGLTGIPLWIIGNNRKTKAEVAMKAFDMKTENSVAAGVGITIRF